MESLDFATNDELLDELKRRFVNGIICVERPAAGRTDEGNLESRRAFWGSPIWGVGAGQLAAQMCMAAYAEDGWLEEEDEEDSD